MKADSLKVQYVAEAYSCCLRVFEYYDCTDIQGKVLLEWKIGEAPAPYTHCLFKRHI